MPHRLYNLYSVRGPLSLDPQFAVSSFFILLLTEFHYHGTAGLGIFFLLFSSILQTRARKQLADESIMNIIMRDRVLMFLCENCI